MPPSSSPHSNASSERPHLGESVAWAGRPIEEADAAMILVHGRGATAQSILALGLQLDLPGPQRDALALLAPQAAGNTWYPYSFMAPITQNEPHLSSALAHVGEVVWQVLGAGIPAERLMLLGFSQGACLTAEFVARHPRRYGGVAILTGGLIGPEGTPRDYPGSLEGTPILLGTSDPDPHVPLTRVLETRDVFEAMGAVVELRVYPGMPHMINNEEIGLVEHMAGPLFEE